MARDPRYDILFEPIKLGPKVARNRMFQASHCTGAGSERPGFQAHHRAIKADGGWAVVGTEYCAVAPEAETTPYISARLWDEGDVRNLTLLTEMAHDRGALARVQLYYSALNNGGLESRMHGVRKSPSHSGADSGMLLAGREMSTQEIREVQGYFVRAARLARDAGFDIVEINITINSLPHQFLLPAFNLRTDEYGGSLENRARFSIELLEQVREAVGHDTAVTARYAVDTLDAPYGLGDLGIRVEGDGGGFMQLADYLVDMWDLVVGWTDGGDRVGPARTHPENWAADVVRRARKFSEKPIGCVGRLTNPDTMVEMIRSGQCDVISAARPTIADPFIPNKIEEGRIQDIRECIGCNICIASWHDSVPVRCTQNPTIGEEWRRGWHPERFAAPGSDSAVLVVGGGPAGLECALSVARRGYAVSLAEAADAFGGRLRFETRLPGLATWGRVLDWRLGQLQRLTNVNLYPGNELSVDDILGLEHPRVVIATGARWTRSLYSTLELPVGELAGPDVYTPDDIAAGISPEGPIVVFDFDNYYMGSLVAEHLARGADSVTYVTPAGHASAWAIMTNEQPQVHRALATAGVAVLTLSRVTALAGGEATVANLFTGAERRLPCRSLVIVGVRRATDSLYQALCARNEDFAAAGIISVDRIGDALAPGAIVHAVHSGHRYARELDCPTRSDPYLRDSPLLPTAPLLYDDGSRERSAP